VGVVSGGEHDGALLADLGGGAVVQHWDRAAQGGDATVAQLAQVWLRAERAWDLVVLHAHQITGPALSWLLGLPSQEGLRVWLISPQPLPRSLTSMTWR
jgi:hypothetical protein